MRQSKQLRKIMVFTSKWVVVMIINFLLCESTFCDVTEGTELVLVFLVHRHGDRTPIQSSMKYSDNQEALEELTAQYGYGQLTNVGKRRSYVMGKFIRNRYDSLISNEYNSSELYLRSTDSTRAKMTALTSMAGVYPPNGNSWSKDIDWIPVPYTTLPQKYDYNLAFLNCPVVFNDYTSKMDTNSSRMDPYRYLFHLFGNYESTLNEKPLLIYSIYDLYVSQASLGVPLSRELKEAWSEVRQAAGEVADELFRNVDNAALQAGPFLQEFYDKTRAVIAGNDTQTLRIYSAHDVTVYYWMTAARVMPKQGVADYNAVFALELRRVVETGQFVVLPVYVSSPEESVQYLQVEGCGTELCEIEKFREIIAPYTLDEKTWRRKCDFDDNVELDGSGL